MVTNIQLQLLFCLIFHFGSLVFIVFYLCSLNVFICVPFVFYLCSFVFHLYSLVSYLCRHLCLFAFHLCSLVFYFCSTCVHLCSFVFHLCSLCSFCVHNLCSLVFLFVWCFRPDLFGLYSAGKPFLHVYIDMGFSSNRFRLKHSTVRVSFCHCVVKTMADANYLSFFSRPSL